MTTRDGDRSPVTVRLKPDTTGALRYRFPAASCRGARDPGRVCLQADREPVAAGVSRTVIPVVSGFSRTVDSFSLSVLIRRRECGQRRGAPVAAERLEQEYARRHPPRLEVHGSALVAE